MVKNSKLEESILQQLCAKAEEEGLNVNLLEQAYRLSLNQIFKDDYFSAAAVAYKAAQLGKQIYRDGQGRQDKEVLHVPSLATNMAESMRRMYEMVARLIVVDCD